jgi:ubiquitin-activating enzyme E1
MAESPAWAKVVVDLIAAQEEAAAVAAAEGGDGGNAANAASMVEMREDAGFMDKYPRQIGTFGLEAMLKLTKMRVLIVGIRGAGIEVAKNTTLAGVHTMGIYDPEPTEVRDLPSTTLHRCSPGKPFGLVP